MNLNAGVITPNGSVPLNGVGTEAPGDDRRGSGTGLPASDGEMSLVRSQAYDDFNFPSRRSVFIDLSCIDAASGSNIVCSNFDSERP